MKLKLFTATVLLTLSSRCVFADNSNGQDKKDDTLKAGAKVGLFYSETSNTSMSFNSAFWLTYKPNKLTQDFKFSSYYTNEEGDEGTNKYSLYYKASYDLGDEWSGYIENEYIYNQYETYRQTYTLNTGLAYKLFDEKKTKLELGVGPGFRYTKRQADDPDYPYDEVSEMIGSAYIKGSKELSKSFSIGGGSKVEYGDSNTKYTTDACIKNKLMEDLSLVLDAKYIYNTNVASDKDHDEIYTTMSLSYDF
ncbi:DUF481 domain-containing protein [Vibrio hannami]|uniref:DUF481 domain-containing protein n=1 Tax=Vibrio hannami TaxID=2717094 RepID=UPI00240ED2AA|nr:DUF481 domain-containing protein [Vibrio hannami]MDG3088491.1 DUF481 domain-containing protein [Vibrio hannami]